MEEELLPANNNKNDRQLMLLKTKSKYCCCGPINLFAFGGFACSAIHVTYLALFGIAIINISIPTVMSIHHVLMKFTNTREKYLH